METADSLEKGVEPTEPQKVPSGLLQKFRRINRLFLLTVVVPTTLAALYYGMFASDIYISESG